MVSTDWKPVVELSFLSKNNQRDNEVKNIEELIAVKGIKAIEIN